MLKANAQPLLPAYLVTGVDALKRRRVLERLEQRVGASGDLSLNMEKFSGEAAEGDQIVNACNTLPLASDLRLVLVEAADKLKAPEREAIIDYLKAPNDSTVLCLVCNGLQKNTRLYKAVAALGKQAVILCDPPKRKDLPTQVRAMATGKGITLTPAAAQALVDRVGENTVALDAQLQKLALAHMGTDPVNENEVTSQVAATAEMKPWDFTDAFAQRNVRKCLLVRSRLEGTSPYALLGMCVTRVRELIIARSLLDRGQIGALATVLHQPAWRVRNHAMWARGFSKEELRRALVSARDAERDMKSGTDPESAFQAWWLGAISR